MSTALLLNLHLQRPNQEGARNSLGTFDDLGTGRVVGNINPPELRAIWRYGLSGNWEDAFNEEGLQPRDALALAMKFGSDGAVNQKLSQYQRSTSSSSDLSDLLISGLNSRADAPSAPSDDPSSSGFSSRPPKRLSPLLTSLRIIQNYVDRTSDVQTAALLAAHVRRSVIPSPAVAQAVAMQCDRWIDEYETGVLARSVMFFERAAARDARATLAREMGEPVDLGDVQLMLRCH